MHNLIYLARQGSVYDFYNRDVLTYFKVVDKLNFLGGVRFIFSLLSDLAFAVLNGIFVFNFRQV